MWEARPSSICSSPARASPSRPKTWWVSGQRPQLPLECCSNQRICAQVVLAALTKRSKEKNAQKLQKAGRLYIGARAAPKWTYWVWPILLKCRLCWTSCRCFLEKIAPALRASPGWFWWCSLKPLFAPLPRAKPRLLWPRPRRRSPLSPLVCLFGGRHLILIRQLQNLIQSQDRHFISFLSQKGADHQAAVKGNLW